MDLYSSDVGQIQQGNMRSQSVMNANESIKAHNDNLANTLTTLKGQQQSSDVLEATKDATSQFWSAGKVPSQITAFQDHIAAGGTMFSNPVSRVSSDAQALLKNSPTTPEVSGDIPELKDVGDGVFESEGALAGAEEGAGSLAGSVAKGVGALGSVAMAGVDIYKDIDSFEHGGPAIAGDNWASKTSNILQIGGAIADVGGTVFPPLALVGGAVDLIAGGFGEAGDVMDASKQKKDDASTLSQGTESFQASAPQQVQATGRVS